jgi:thiol:disulfide interchange protein
MPTSGALGRADAGRDRPRLVSRTGFAWRVGNQEVIVKSIVAALALALASPYALARWREDPTPAPKPATKPAQPLRVYDEAAVGSEQIAAASKRAQQRDGTRVLIQWGANWCGRCKLLAATMKSDKELARELSYEYEVVKIDVGQFDKHTDLAPKYGVPIQQGIPYLTFLDANGKLIENHDTCSLEDPTPDSHRDDPAQVLALLKEHETPRVEATKLREAALARAKSEGKRVFLHFGAPWCGWCHKLEDWMARPEVAALLGKEFVDLKIDTERRLGGQEMLDAVRGSKDGGIPWFACLDADGNVLATSGAATENIGFPASADEMARFRSMLHKAATKLTLAEIDALTKSLAPSEKRGA